MVTVEQGDIVWAEAEDQRRPVLIVTRTEAIPVLNRLLVAPITRTVRNIPTEVLLQQSHGMSVECAASFDNLQPISLRLLTSPIGKVPRSAICAALAALADC
ncbi:MAG: type II toxin-antitoxin system PemK/MazF family toxin [Actinobacteria bacterium]|nr:type II toxin-antitoxin system PemK/MazF family toxin [Actinomycetota bacterium]